MGHARALINIENVDTQLSIYRQIIREDLSVRKAEAMARAAGSNIQEKSATAAPSPNDAALRQLQQKLSSHFGSRIQVTANQNNRGEIRIPFVSTQDLNRILEILDL
jgi:ParB family chromosome partitioning protein